MGNIKYPVILDKNNFEKIEKMNQNISFNVFIHNIKEKKIIIK